MANILKGKVEPGKLVTDPVVISLARGMRLKVSKGDMTFEADYHIPHKMFSNPTFHPFAKLYGINKGKHQGAAIQVISGLPMTRSIDGQKCNNRLTKSSGKYLNTGNQFDFEMDNGRIELIPVNRQPNGATTTDNVEWDAVLKLDGETVNPVSDWVLLPVDPTNGNYKNNTLQRNYGICLRRVRIVEGRAQERWVFFRNPGGEVRIEHNKTGKAHFALGGVEQPHEGMLVEVDGDVEIIRKEMWDEERFYPVIICASATFYPEDDPETYCCDGWVRRTNNSGESWDTMHGHTTGTTASSTSNGLGGLNWKTYTDPNWRWFERAFLGFNTASLDDAAIISAVTESVYGNSTFKTFGSTLMDSCICDGSPASPTDVVTADWNDSGTTLYSDTVKAWASWVTGGFNNFVFNATGRAAVNKTGITQTCLKDKSHDRDDVFHHPADHDYVFMSSYAADQGNGFKPKLVVTYTVVVAPTVSTVIPAELVTGVSARIKGNVTNTGGENPTRYLQYGKTVGYELGSFDKGVGGTGIYLHDLSSLDGGTKYYFRAYATNSEGTGYGAQADFNTDIEELISVTAEAEISIQKHLTIPISVIAEPGIDVNKELTMPISVMAEAEIEGELIVGWYRAISVLAEAGIEVGKTLIMPISVMAEAQIEGTLLAGLIKSISVLAEAGVEVGQHLQLPISVLAETGVVGNFNFQKAISIMAEAEVSATIHLILFSKSDVLINIWNVDKQVN